MNIITIDFESAYGGDLGFRTQTTEEYVRDPRFEVIGVAVQVNDGEPEWFSGSMTETATFLKQFDWGTLLRWRTTLCSMGSSCRTTSASNPKAGWTH